MKNIWFALLLLCSLQTVAQSANTDKQNPTFYLSDVKTKVAEKQGVYTANIATVLSAPRITCSLAGYTIKSFTLSILPTKGDLNGPFVNTGNELTQPMKDALKAHTGTTGKIFIDDIMVVGPDKHTRAVNSIVVRYTN